MLGKKIICQVCFNQTDGFCSFKKTKIKLKKKRLCGKFRQDMSKIKIKRPIDTIRRPDWFWDRDERRKEYKKQLKELQELQAKKEQQDKKIIVDNKDIQIINPVKNAEHPLTGDLSRFSSTASKKR